MSAWLAFAISFSASAFIAYLLGRVGSLEKRVKALEGKIALLYLRIAKPEGREPSK